MTNENFVFRKKKQKGEVIILKFVVKKNGLGKLIILSLILSLIMGFGGLIMPGTVNAASDAVTIKGNGLVSETATTFTRAQLEEMGTVELRYSTINTWPTKNWYVGRGVLLETLLEAAGGIKDEAKMITVKSVDGFTAKFTVQELLKDPRYYYPGLKQNHEFFGNIPGSIEGAEPVPAMIALESSNSDNFNQMNKLESLHFLLGQRYVTEQTNHTFVKYVGTIEVTTDEPLQWDAPEADVPSGTVTAGTKVKLTNQFNDADKIYYTIDYADDGIDGIDPTLESLIYNWIASRWWSQRADVLEEINHPIVVDRSMTIRAKTIGFGRTDSEIATFTYLVEQSSIKGDINNDGAVDISDVVQAVNYALGETMPTPEQFNIADLNDDGSIDIQDVVQIVNKALESNI